MPKPMDTIAAELAAAGCRAIREGHCAELSRLLLDDEYIIGSLIGSRLESNSAWLRRLVATSNRIVSLRQSVKTSSRGAATGFDRPWLVYIMWRHIASVSLSDRQMMFRSNSRGVADVGFSSYDRHSFDGVPPVGPEEVRAIGEQIRTRLDRLHTSFANETVVDETLIGKLERLARLRESGVLDEEEFRAAKRKLLLD